MDDSGKAKKFDIVTKPNRNQHRFLKKTLHLILFLQNTGPYGEGERL